MCNLYKMRRTSAEVAGLFRGVDRADGANRGELLFPGYPGLVVAEGEVRQMVWGFPLPQISKKTGKPIKPKAVNNARTDKLQTPFWRSSFERRRCLIPLEAFAEAEGKAGAMTRTWLSLPDQPVFACAGIWRPSEEWGDVYSMVMTDPSPQSAEVHDRMPVILDPADWQQWTGGTPAEAFDLCQPYAGTLTIERTAEPWVKR